MQNIIHLLWPIRLHKFLIAELKTFKVNFARIIRA